MVTDIGGLNDRSFNAVGLQGPQARRVRARRRHPRADVEVERRLRAEPLVARAPEVRPRVRASASSWREATEKVANSFPNTKFAIIDSSQAAMKTQAEERRRACSSRSSEAGYLAGYMAGLYVKDKGGDQVDLLGRRPEDPAGRPYIAGYQAGAKAANPKIKTLNAYSQDFVDQAKCKEIALNQIAEGSQVVFAGRRRLRPRRARRRQGEGRPGHRRRRRPGLPRRPHHDLGDQEDRRGRVHGRQGGPGRLAQGRHRQVFDAKNERRRLRQDQLRGRQVRGPGQRAARARSPRGEITDIPTKPTK